MEIASDYQAEFVGLLDQIHGVAAGIGETDHLGFGLLGV
jgi:hypothetical protein